MIDVDFNGLKTICSHAHSDAAALEFALEWAESAEQLALKLQAERDAMKSALQAAVDCGMVPTSTAKNGGASKHSRQVQVADQIRAALLPNTGDE